MDNNIKFFTLFLNLYKKTDNKKNFLISVFYFTTFWAVSWNRFYFNSVNRLSTVIVIIIIIVVIVIYSFVSIIVFVVILVLLIFIIVIFHN